MTVRVLFQLWDVSVLEFLFVTRLSYILDFSSALLIPLMALRSGTETPFGLFFFFFLYKIHKQHQNFLCFLKYFNWPFGFADGSKGQMYCLTLSLPSLTSSSRRLCVLPGTMSVDTGSTAIILISSFPSVYCNTFSLVYQY